MNSQARFFHENWTIARTLVLIAASLGSMPSCHRSPTTTSPDHATAESKPPEISDTAQHEITTFCSGCHAMPKPGSFPKSAWYDEVKRGFDFYHQSNRKDLIAPPMETVVEYFRSRAPNTLAAVTIQSVTGPDRIRFHTIEIDRITSSNPDSPAVAVSFVTSWPANEDRKRNVLFSDMAGGGIYTANPNASRRVADCVARLNHPAAASRCDLNGNGHPDLVIADLGSFLPEDHDRGRVVWVPDPGEEHPAQSGIPVAEGLGRVADVQPADFDGDGDIDLVVAEFGWHKTGRILWLRNDGTVESPKFVQQVIDPRPGTIHVPVVDLNRDGRPDFVALISQEFEVIEAFLNQGDGTFQKHTIHSADDPAFGSSGIQIADLDGDGDPDVLYTNGDMFDSFVIKPYHGIQWLENTGTYPFQPHQLTVFPGVHRALAADLDLDGDLDVVASAFLPATVRATDAAKQLDSLIWLEQSSPGNFIRHRIEHRNCIHAAMDVSDFDGDGDLDIAVGSFRDRDSQDQSAVTIWWNEISVP